MSLKYIGWMTPSATQINLVGVRTTRPQDKSPPVYPKTFCPYFETTANCIQLAIAPEQQIVFVLKQIIHTTILLFYFHTIQCSIGIRLRKATVNCQLQSAHF